MTPSTDPHPVDDAAARARAWLAEADAEGGGRQQRTAAQLAALVADPGGLDLAVRFVDEVARPPDVEVAARALARLGRDAQQASFLGGVDRTLFAAGGRAATLAPRLVVPAARRRLRALVGHLVGDTGRGLDRNLADARADGVRLNVNLLGEAVLGHDEASARLARTIDLVRRPGVDYVSVKVSAVAAQLVTWDLDGSRARVVEHLLPLFRAARDHGTFVNLDMEEYRDLALTVAVFTDLLGRDELAGVSAGIALQAYLPDAVAALDEVSDFALARVGDGGAPVKVRLVKGANLAMEQVESELHGWPQAPYGGKPDVDAQYVRLLLRALDPERTRAVRVGCASHNLFHVAYALELARDRGVGAALDVEMLQGMAPAEAAAVHDDLAAVEGADHLVLYTPVVDPADFDVAVAYLVRRLEENAAPQNFLHATLAGGAGGIDAQEAAFRAAVVRAAATTPDDLAPRRRPRAGVPDDEHDGAGSRGGFWNAPDTDPAVAASRSWAAEIVARDPASVHPRTAPLASADDVDAVVARALAAAPGWAAVPPGVRGDVLRSCADRLEDARADLVATMVHEAGKTVAESDPEVSEAVDLARWYAGSADRLHPDHPDAFPGVRFTPRGVTLVTPPWNFPVAIPAGGVLAALAAGSPVVAKPAHPAPRCFEVVVDAIHAALDAHGIARDVVQLVRVPESDLGRRLVTHPDIARVVLTGSIDTARLFARWRPALDVLAETSGKNAIVVTASADPDLAVADVVRSAFGHAGQKCSAASLLILVGTAGDPRSPIGRRLRRGLVSAVRSLAVGPPTDLGTVMGPLTEPADGKLLRALTRLDPGERWLVEPRRLDDAGRLWTPGLKDGVQPGSWFHLTECFGPVLGIMTAEQIDDAVEIQDDVAFGLTGGIHSLDDAEIDEWLATVHVGNAYVNRHITGAIVRRQPFGGWKASSVGPGAKAGGPHYVAQLGDWTDASPTAGGPPDRDESPLGWLAWAAADDARAWTGRFSREHDPSGLRAESNVLRYRPVEHLTVRVGDGALPVEVDRVRHAARTAGVTVTVSDVDHERHTSFAARVREGKVTGRIRVIGAAPGLRDAAAERVGAVTVLDQRVVASGERELLTVVREQAVSRTRHRYGHLER
ncbi:bifunctional proline dehydrogenase/L-glutamate gamma-semialdehyde dehydrogenase [Luteimicrobium subarcticum]|uniref:L-glutamate gamma-semialdehyde dehydrogenase n=1 Tax=Luteimicrobium subarcticum TaxID=620910 RepID=A0A2M8WTD3_9MICO|nr:bifunctional proline dehydrogenase/L-glutamate gamma-semialdehyde dehydrogenase [Luteimicrobium subarcticum]PJI94211.1 L-proline dehydrogenase [Luteimicrobium subarcticum]